MLQLFILVSDVSMLCQSALLMVHAGNASWLRVVWKQLFNRFSTFMLDIGYNERLCFFCQFTLLCVQDANALMRLKTCHHMAASASLHLAKTADSTDQVKL